MPRRTLVLLFAPILLVSTLVSAAPAWAQEAPADDSTTSTSAPPLTLAPTTTTTTTEPDPNDPVGGGDAPNESVPVVDETVPPRKKPKGAAEEAFDEQAAYVVRAELQAAESAVIDAMVAHELAVHRVKSQTRRLRSLRTRIAALETSQRVAVQRVEIARERFEERAADALIRGNSAELVALLDARDPTEYGTRATFIESVLEEDERTVDEYLAAKEQLDRDLLSTAEALDRTKKLLKRSRNELEMAARNKDAANFNLAVFAAGGEIVISGFVFPVDDPHSFWDGWGAPRMMGTKYEHWHQGTDILAPAGTKLFACERGIITSLGTDVLGGIKVWLKGESGTYYYYAHLTSYAKGLHVGQVVEAGEVIGYVGTTGNAKGGPPHLHFEIHPDGGEAVNPYPLLAVVDRLREMKIAAMGETADTS